MIPKDYYEEEIRNDFKVTEKRKKVWAVEIDLLEQFDRCCQQHSFEYFVSGGTLLGAIRHKGFIPWDDDIDVYMERETYLKFIGVAPLFFTGKYHFQHYSTEKKYYKTHAQLRNSKTTAILKQDAKKGISYNQGIFIDIFPIDGLPDDSKKKEKFVKKIIKNQNIIYKYITFNDYSQHSLKGMLTYYTCRIIGIKRIIKHHEKIIAKYSNTGKNVCDISFFGKKYHIWKRALLQKKETYPFEYINVIGLKEYDYFLKVQYGDYMNPIIAPSEHGKVFFDTERPYTYYLNEGRKELEKYANSEY